MFFTECFFNFYSTTAKHSPFVSVDSLHLYGQHAQAVCIIEKLQKNMLNSIIINAIFFKTPAWNGHIRRGIRNKGIREIKRK